MSETTIKNRHGLDLVIAPEVADNQKGLVFIAHGLGGYRTQRHIQDFAQPFREAGYTLVLWDATNSFGQSGGDYEQATTTNYYEDLQDVVAWATDQDWYEEPFVLAAHSLGGMSVALYAQEHPEQVKALAPISTVVSGKLSALAFGEEFLMEWKRRGYREEPRHEGGVKKLQWSHMEDRLKYDLLTSAHRLTMPVLLMVGGGDVRTPYEHQKMFFDAIPQGKKELHVIPDVEHSFRPNENSSEQIQSYFRDWIAKL